MLEGYSNSANVQHQFFLATGRLVMLVKKGYEETTQPFKEFP